MPKNDYWDAVNLDDEQINLFLEEKDLGVLSLSKDNDPYGIPLCYVHSQANNALYFNFGLHDQSKKQRYIEENPRASFAVYDREGGTNVRSVIVEGTVKKIEDEDEKERAEELLLRRKCAAPLYFWGVASEDLDFRFYKLDITEKHGRDSEIQWPSSIKREIKKMLE